MKPLLNDDEVIQNYLMTNSSDCFETLYNRYVNKVYNRGLSLTKDSEKAQHFTHDIFAEMSCINGFQERSSFSTWLYSISYNYCVDPFRTTNRTATSSPKENTRHTNTHTDASEDPLLHLTSGMKVLTNKEARLLRLKYEDELQIKQIARLLDLKDSAVKMRLKRARDKVRQFYLNTTN